MIILTNNMKLTLLVSNSPFIEVFVIALKLIGVVNIMEHYEGTL